MIAANFIANKSFFELFQWNVRMESPSLSGSHGPRPTSHSLPVNNDHLRLRTTWMHVNPIVLYCRTSQTKVRTHWNVDIHAGMTFNLLACCKWPWNKNYLIFLLNIFWHSGLTAKTQETIFIIFTSFYSGLTRKVQHSWLVGMILWFDNNNHLKANRRSNKLT